MSTVEELIDQARATAAEYREFEPGEYPPVFERHWFASGVLLDHLADALGDLDAEVRAAWAMEKRMHHERDDAEAKLAAIRELHRDAGPSQGYTRDPADYYGDIEHCCYECGEFGEYGEPWPCPTVRILDGETKGAV